MSDDDKFEIKIECCISLASLLTFFSLFIVAFVAVTQHGVHNDVIVGLVARRDVLVGEDWLGHHRTFRC